jgi:hypothetical protein
MKRKIKSLMLLCQEIHHREYNEKLVKEGAVNMIYNKK